MLFLNKHCTHLLKPLILHTSIPVEYRNPKYLKLHLDVINLKQRSTTELFKNLQNFLGVYF